MKLKVESLILFYLFKKITKKYDADKDGCFLEALLFSELVIVLRA